MYHMPSSTEAGALEGVYNLKSVLRGSPVATPDADKNALVNWAKTQGRVFVLDSTSTFLYACATLLMLGFLSTLGPDTTTGGAVSGNHESDRKHRYVAALAFVACMISAKQLRSISKFRSFNFGHASTAAKFSDEKVTAFEDRNTKFSVGIELACNAIRHVDQLVSFIFLVHLFYFLAGTETAAGTTIKTGDMFDSQTAPILLAVLSVLLSATVKIGFDDFWVGDFKTRWHVGIPGLIAWGLSVLLLLPVVIDIDEAVSSAKGDDNVELYRSFYLLWIGYPIVAAVGVLDRLCNEGELSGWVAFLQDVLYGLLDAWCKGVLALWVAFTLFGVTLLNAPLATPLNNH